MSINTAETLTKLEIEALVAFWKRFMAARKRYYELCKSPVHGFSDWSVYYETKLDCFRVLSESIPDLARSDFSSVVLGWNAKDLAWRDIQNLQPKSLVQDILTYRRNKAKQKEKDDNQT